MVDFTANPLKQATEDLLEVAARSGSQKTRLAIMDVVNLLREAELDHQQMQAALVEAKQESQQFKLATILASSWKRILGVIGFVATLLTAIYRAIQIGK